MLAVDKPRHMGRPPLGGIGKSKGLKLTIRLLPSMKRRMDAVLEGKEKRASLIRSALEREIDRREAQKPKKR